MPPVIPPFAVSRRRFLAEVGAAAILSGVTLPARAAGSTLPTPPVTPRIPLTRTQVGRTRIDPYAWIKYVPASGQRSIETLPAPVREHLLAENVYAKAVLDRVAADEAAFYKTMQARAPLGNAEPGLTRDGWAYDKAYPDGSHAVYSRRRVGAAKVDMLLDEAVRATGQAYYRTTGQQVSPDGKSYAWAEDVGGNDRHRICVRDIASGTVRTLVDSDAYGYGALVFSPSSDWLFWIWRDARNRPPATGVR
jgi:oligopeptidase B